jgi:cytochrome b561
MKPAASADVRSLNAAASRRRSVRHYRSLAKGFHWLTAALVLALVASGVIMKQLTDGAVADTLLALHKLVGALTLTIVLIRLSYRFVGLEPAGAVSYRRPTVHWMLYGIIIMVPLLGWAGVSDFGGRDIFFGYALPQIWPEGSGYGDLMLTVHAWLAFGLLGLVVLHIGNALQDYMMRARD